MKCVRCARDNAPASTLCAGCGAALAPACAGCAAPLPERAKFCPECGLAVASAGAGPGPSAAAAGLATPRHLAERILASKVALEGERKQVTVLFADLKGSLEILSTLDPEQARAVLDPVLERMIESVHRYEGTVNQVMGDGIMALFGAPLAHEDHALRACYAALAMHAAIAADAAQRAPALGPAPRIRVGLNSGEVVVRAIRNDLHMDYSAVGQTTHLAARMEQIAEPGDTYVTATTARLVEGFFSLDALGPQAVKGYAAPVDVHRLVDALPVASRLQVAARRGLTRFTDRSHESGALAAARARVRDAGRGEVIAVEGEAGVGKSRLLWEFAHSPSGAGWLALEADALAYGGSSAFRPVADLLKALLRVERHDATATVGDKLQARLEELDEPAGARLAPLQALLDLPVDDAGWPQLEPREQRARVLEAGHWLLAGHSRRQPLLVVLEQLHGVDAETQAFLEGLVQLLPATRILLLLSYRAGYRHGWRAGIGFMQLRLEPLDPASGDELLAALLGPEPALAPLKARLLELTGGNPFFIEESVRTLVESGVLQGQRGGYRLAAPMAALRMPDTVQAILASRIDRLAPEDKQLLQAAAVIGKNVPLELLQAIAGLPEERVLQGMAALQAAEFLIPVGLFPQVQYTFKQSLTHEVAGSMLLVEQRRRLHRRVAEWYEQTQGDDLTPHLALLAFHWEGAEAPARAVDYLEREAVRLFSLGLARQSVQVGLHGARLLGVDLPADPAVIGPQIGAQMQAIGARMAGRAPAELMALPPLADASVERVLALLLRIGPFAFQSQQIELYLLLSATCMRLTLEHGNGALAPSVYSMYSVVHRAITGDRVGAVAFSTLALELDQRQGRQQLAQVGFVHGWFHSHWTQPLAQSLPLTRDAWEAGLAGGDIMFACFNLSSYVIYLAALGRPLPEVIATAREHLQRNGGRVLNAAFHLRHEMQFAKALAGLTVDPLSMSDAEHDEARDIASICETELGNQIGYYLVSRVKLHAWFGDWAGALQWAERARPLLPAFEGQVAEIELAQFSAIAALMAAAEAPPSEATALDGARAAAAQLRAWAGHCPANFAHKASLLEALLAGVDGDSETAAHLHAQAAQQAEAGQYLHDAALAHELAARWHRRCGREMAALDAQQAALAAYARWGAAGKVAQLRQAWDQATA